MPISNQKGDHELYPGRTFSSSIQIVRAVAKRPNVLGEPDARLQFGFQDIAFV